MNSRLILNFFRSFPQTLLTIVLHIILFRWITDLIRLCLENRKVKKRGKYIRDNRRGRSTRCSPRCATITPDVYKRPDPLIYSQKYLREQGLAVTWNNPDIQLYKDGQPVSSSNLEVDTKYEVIATIFNNSIDAPAVGMPVEFSFLGFGVGTASHAIGTTIINLPVKGAPGHPAPAKMIWHTPLEVGHYCMKVKLIWSEDANPKNNLGQENTNVGHFSSPALFEFPVRNEDTLAKRIRMTVDTYAIPEPIDCRKKPKKKESDKKHPNHKRKAVFVPPLEEEADWTFARVMHNPNSYPVPPGWNVVIDPDTMMLAPNQEQIVKVTITPADGFTGEQTFNINALHGNELIGGVTLTVSPE